MRKVLDVFHRIANELLVDEENKPVADYIPSSKLYETLDLSLKSVKNGKITAFRTFVLKLISLDLSYHDSTAE